MDLKSFIDQHPISVITIVIIGTAAVVGGFITTVERKEKAKLTNQIQELEFKLSSIERKIGDGKVYFDIRKLLIKQQDARRLPGKYRSYERGTIYVNVPNDDSWGIEDTNKYKFTEDKYGKECERVIEGEIKKNLYKNTRLLVWRKNEKIRTILTHRDSNHKILPSNINYFPSLALQVFPIESMENLGIKNIKESNFSTVVLSHKIRFNMFQTEQYENTDFRIINTQKKGPIFYMLSELIHRNAVVEGVKNKKDIIVENECLFVSLKNTGVLINITIPIIEKQSEAYSWVSGWLAGLRIVNN